MSVSPAGPTLTNEEIEKDLVKRHPEWKPAQRALVARLCDGAVGRARSFDLEAYMTARKHALAILNSALRGGEHSELFKITESYRPGAEGREKTEALIRTLYSLLLLGIPAVLLIVAGISLWCERGGGLYWITAAVAAGFVSSTTNAWVLLVEIKR